MQVAAILFSVVQKQQITTMVDYSKWDAMKFSDSAYKPSPALLGSNGSHTLEISRVGKTGVTDYTFTADERDDDTQCNVVSGRAEGVSVSSLRLPMSF